MNGFSHGLKRHTNEIFLILSIVSFYGVSNFVPRISSELSGSLSGYYMLLAIFSLGILAVLGSLYIYIYKPSGAKNPKIQAGAFTIGVTLAGLSYVIFLGLQWVIYNIQSINFGGVAYVLFWIYALSIGLTFSIIIKTVEAIVYSDEDDKSLLAPIAGGILSALYIVSPGTTYISTLILLFGLGMAATLLYQKYGLLALTGFMSTVYLAWSLSPIQFNGPVLAHSVLATITILVVAYTATSLTRKKLQEYKGSLSWKTILVIGVLAVSSIGILAGLSSGYRAYVVVTGSMEPTLNIGDLVVVSPKSSYETGDIISFDYNGVIITHRIYSVLDDNTIRTKGDANAEPDPYVITSDIVIGALKLRIPVIGWIIILLNWNIYSRLAIAGLSIIVIAYVILRK
ncbi:MAG: signal peptidase I [Desulfurococcales archaeon]|nr:signal peptidase I [Desulfurococcales archaeon]